MKKTKKPQGKKSAATSTYIPDVDTSAIECTCCKVHSPKEPQPKRELNNKEVIKKITEELKRNFYDKPECSCEICKSWQGGDCLKQVCPKCQPPKEKLCGLNHSHNYWNCCAACIHGEVKGEGASGHVKACKYYKEEPSKEKEFICPCCKEINTHGLRCPFREEPPKEESLIANKHRCGGDCNPLSGLHIEFTESATSTKSKKESGWMSGYKAGIDEGYGMMENAVKEAKRDLLEQIEDLLEEPIEQTTDGPWSLLHKYDWAKLKEEILGEKLK